MMMMINEIGLPHALKSQELNSRFLFSIHAFVPSVVLCFQCLLDSSAHSPACFHNPLQPVISPEVGMWLPARRLNGCIPSVLDQKGVSQACCIVEIYHSGPEPSNAKQNPNSTVTPRVRALKWRRWDYCILVVSTPDGRYYWAGS